MRTGHATTTLLIAGKAKILIDPGLPGAAITARLAERANLGPEAITHVFLTSFHPDTRRGSAAFSKAQWLISEMEREALGVPLASRLRDEMGRENADQELIVMLKTDVELLARFQPAPDSLAEGVDLFPMLGVTPGMCAVLVPDQKHTTLITGDAIPTLEHMERGVMTTGAIDIRAAQESFKEAPAAPPPGRRPGEGSPRSPGPPQASPAGPLRRRPLPSPRKLAPRRHRISDKQYSNAARHFHHLATKCPKLARIHTAAAIHLTRAGI